MVRELLMLIKVEIVIFANFLLLRLLLLLLRQGSTHYLHH